MLLTRRQEASLTAVHAQVTFDGFSLTVHYFQSNGTVGAFSKAQSASNAAILHYRNQPLIGSYQSAPRTRFNACGRGAVLAGDRQKITPDLIPLHILHTEYLNGLKIL